MKILSDWLAKSLNDSTVHPRFIWQLRYCVRDSRVKAQYSVAGLPLLLQLHQTRNYTHQIHTASFLQLQETIDRRVEHRQYIFRLYRWYFIDASNDFECIQLW